MDSDDELDALFAGTGIDVDPTAEVEGAGEEETEAAAAAAATTTTTTTGDLSRDAELDEIFGDLDDVLNDGTGKEKEGEAASAADAEKASSTEQQQQQEEEEEELAGEETEGGGKKEGWNAMGSAEQEDFFTWLDDSGAAATSGGADTSTTAATAMSTATATEPSTAVEAEEEHDDDRPAVHAPSIRAGHFTLGGDSSDEDDEDDDDDEEGGDAGNRVEKNKNNRNDPPRAAEPAVATAPTSAPVQGAVEALGSEPRPQNEPEQAETIPSALPSVHQQDAESGRQFSMGSVASSTASNKDPLTELEEELASPFTDPGRIRALCLRVPGTLPLHVVTQVWICLLRREYAEDREAETWSATQHGTQLELLQRMRSDALSAVALKDETAPPSSDQERQDVEEEEEQRITLAHDIADIVALLCSRHGVTYRPFYAALAAPILVATKQSAGSVARPRAVASSMFDSICRNFLPFLNSSQQYTLQAQNLSLTRGGLLLRLLVTYHAPKVAQHLERLEQSAIAEASESNGDGANGRRSPSPPPANRSFPKGWWVPVQWVASMFAGLLPARDLFQLWQACVVKRDRFAGFFLATALLCLHEKELLALQSLEALHRWSDAVFPNMVCRGFPTQSPVAAGTAASGEEKKSSGDDDSGANEGQDDPPKSPYATAFSTWTALADEMSAITPAAFHRATLCLENWAHRRTSAARKKEEQKQQAAQQSPTPQPQQPSQPPQQGQQPPQSGTFWGQMSSDFKRLVQHVPLPGTQDTKPVGGPVYPPGTEDLIPAHRRAFRSLDIGDRLCAWCDAEDAVPQLCATSQERRRQQSGDGSGANGAAKQVRYFGVDCRRGREVQVATLPTTFRLDPDTLSDLDAIDSVMATLAPLAQENVHLCLIGAGPRYHFTLQANPQTAFRAAVQERSQLNACALFLIKRGFRYVSILEGGYGAAVEFVCQSDNPYRLSSLVDVDRVMVQRIFACDRLAPHYNPDTTSLTGENLGAGAEAGANASGGAEGLTFDFLKSRATDLLKKTAAGLNVADGSEPESTAQSTTAVPPNPPAATQQPSPSLLSRMRTGATGGAAKTSASNGEAATNGGGEDSAGSAAATNGAATASATDAANGGDAGADSTIKSTFATLRRISQSVTAGAGGAGQGDNATAAEGDQQPQSTARRKLSDFVTFGIRGVGGGGGEGGEVSAAAAKATPQFTIDDDEEDEDDEEGTTEEGAKGVEIDDAAAAAVRVATTDADRERALAKHKLAGLQKGDTVRVSQVDLPGCALFHALKYKQNAEDEAGEGEPLKVHRFLAVSEERFIVLDGHGSVDVESEATVKSNYHLTQLKKLSFRKRDPNFVTLFFESFAPKQGEGAAEGDADDDAARLTAGDPAERLREKQYRVKNKEKFVQLLQQHMARFRSR